MIKMAVDTQTPFYDTRKIYHGTQKVVYQTTGQDKAGHSTGVTQFAPKVDQNSKTIYADAQTHMTLIAPKKLTITVKNYQFTDDEMAQMGHKKVGDGFIDVGDHPTFDIQRILIEQDETGKETQVLEAYYGCTSSDYTESDDEDSDAINAKQYTRTITVNGKDFQVGDGGASVNVKTFRIERSDSNASVFDKYTEKVLTPSDFTTAAGAGH